MHELITRFFAGMEEGASDEGERDKLELIREAHALHPEAWERAAELASEGWECSYDTDGNSHFPTTWYTVCVPGGQVRYRVEMGYDVPYEAPELSTFEVEGLEDLPDNRARSLEVLDALTYLTGGYSYE